MGEVLKVDNILFIFWGGGRRRERERNQEQRNSGRLRRLFELKIAMHLKITLSAFVCPVESVTVCRFGFAHQSVAPSLKAFCHAPLKRGQGR